MGSRACLVGPLITKRDLESFYAKRPDLKVLHYGDILMVERQVNDRLQVIGIHHFPDDGLLDLFLAVAAVAVRDRVLAVEMLTELDR